MATTTSDTNWEVDDALWSIIEPLLSAYWLRKRTGRPLACLRQSCRLPGAHRLGAILVDRSDDEEHLPLDKAFDNPTARDAAASCGYVAHLRTLRKGTRPHRQGRRQSRHWVVARTPAWLYKCRGILARDNKNAGNYRSRFEVVT